MRVAVIGTGIAGLGAAYLLGRQHELTVFERAPVPGGHTRTIRLRREDGEDLDLDMGFIVHNDRHYPNLLRLFGELGVATQSTQMSFAVSDPASGIEYCASRLPQQPALFARARTRALILEILRFMRHAREALDGRLEGLTLGQFIGRERYSSDFGRLFLVPLTAALWSTALTRAFAFPAHYALSFFDNHGLLSIRRQHWATVVGGSSRYVEALLAQVAPRHTLSVGMGVRAVRRGPDGVEITTHDGVRWHFDAVVIATHADQALTLLVDPTRQERKVLGAFGYTRNEVVLHTDERLLPRRVPVRGAWNYQACPGTPPDLPAVTYYLNRLQRLRAKEHYCVTLNRTPQIDPERILHRVVFEHPRYTFESLKAQERLAEISGGRTWFCGAYHGNGFHEAGLVSGLAAAAGLGARW